ncbi:MAG: macro domain-containing protein [Bacteroidota bacterium]|nr:macro domain-containing protein [Bacteroidota bacterium]
MKKEINRITLEILQGDIIDQQDMDTIVNAANARLLPGGGVAGAIHQAAGPELAKESEPLGPIEPGEAVITRAHKLPNKHVIHCLGPVYGRDKPEDKLLANCYRNALKLAEDNGIESIAFPSISTGAFGFPVEEAAEIAIRTITENLPELKSVKKIRMVLYSRSDKIIYENTLQEFF